MRTALLPLSAGLALIGCNNDYQLTKAQRPDAELALADGQAVGLVEARRASSVEVAGAASSGSGRER